MADSIKIGYISTKYSSGAAFVTEAEKLTAERCDLVMTLDGVFPEVNYKNELDGKSDLLVEIGKISAELDALTLCDVKTDNYGVKLKSVVASCGKLLGVSDATKSYGGAVGVGYKSYAAKGFKVGVLVGLDFVNPLAYKSLCDCECDLICAFMSEKCALSGDTLACSLAYLFGVGVCFTVGGNLFAASSKGELSHMSSDGASFLVNVKKPYKLITQKIRL